MAEASIHQIATDGAASKSHRVRRVVLGLAALVVLGCGGGFLWLVAVELRTERSLSRPLPASAVFPEEQSTTDELIADLESAIGVTLDVDWQRFHRTDRTYGSNAWRHTLLNGDRAIGYIAVALIASDPMPKLHLDVEARTISTIDLASGRPEFTAALVWYIEGNTVVITTPDRVPRFDASAKAREWWHALEKWWEGGP